MNSSIWSFMDRAGFEMFHYLLSVLWQSSLLFTGVFLLLYLIRKRGAALRHKLLLFALLLSPFLPLLTKGIQKIGAPQQGVTILSPYTEPSLVPSNYYKQNQASSTKSPVPIDTDIQPPTTNHQQSTIPNQQPTTHNAQHAFPTYYPWAIVGICYLLGAFFFLCWIILGRLRIRRWRLDSIPCTTERVLKIFHNARKSLGIEKNILILESGNVPAPLSIGTLHPAIFIPENLEFQIDDEELTAIAFHETAHIKRYDSLILNAAALVRAILFFHPLIWMAVRRISNYAEMSADDAALEHSVQPLSYAKLLTRISENLSRRPLSTEMATGLLFTKSAFLKRVEAILGDRPRLRRISRFALIACLLAVLISLFFSLSFPLKVKAFAEESKRQEKLSEDTIRIANWRFIISSQAMEDVMELSLDGIHDEKKFKSMIVPSEEMIKFFRESLQNGNGIIFTDSICWHYPSGSNFGWSFSALISEKRQYLAKGDGHFDAKIKKNNIQMSLNMNLDLEVGNSKKKLPIVSESTLQIGKTLALFLPIEENEAPIYLVMIYQPEEFFPEEIKYISHMNDTQWWLEDGKESVRRVYESFTNQPVVKLKTDLSDQDLSFSGKPLAHFDLSLKRQGKLPLIVFSPLPQDLWIAPANQELARNKSWKFAFDQGDLCVPQPHLLMPLRNARMAPLKIPGRIRVQEPFIERIKRMAKSDILEQISAYEKSDEEKPENGFPAFSGRYYAMIGNKGDLVVIETVNYYPGNHTANFIPLGKVNTALETAEVIQGKDRSLQGSVTDDQGNPIEGAKIINWFPFGSNPQETFTNARGEFRFDQERGYAVIAEKTGFAASFYEFKEKYHQYQREEKNIPPVEIIMTKGGAVSGIIRSQLDNNPIPNANVWIDRWAKDTDVGVNRYIIWKSQPVKTDAQGRFELKNAPEGTLRLHADAKDLAENVSPEFAVDFGSHKEISLDLYPGMELRILVLDKEKETPIEGANIWIYEKGAKISGQDGVCLFPNLSLGNYWLRCTAESYHEMTLKDIAIEEKQGVRELRLLLVPAKNP
ncbi:carboxypeptidase regulatory-like domain-containing protein [Candidatus Sumerlaeota bacterium]|nr:carboxypeptidase regulatory-like domain-containing protein [Candidatus Sumerlaeota bacterium]